ncbi:flagellar assembly protein FliH [Legionella pneumophila]|uniref:Flagellar assembly protein FliH n=1 Tax=Legionella pneumophila subsp. pascullei TaxID=91890 RepID=A0AAX2IWS6_LEGPN|nr:flagellar assembly protein FliH [Legionella pneumophila]AMP89598.1 flagellar assembly protein FliH [Legionella pneumophila subsp. pascullei]AMP92736.1 flagellar assembly protein FliH [Legionella pneumophila subsp. pascullei]AMP95702.1 flagellar assembly protein FliH [Legionella pneumophila subsp. pascullei]SQG90614.1 flagellar assembly protein FliH [Legionella pneumophila subsp. pascullei]VEH07159.1 flagellar assembly protein FliH [Legionella pneumophila subsp. pascullei]
MSNEFEPYNKQVKNIEFTTWEYQPSKGTEQSQPDEEELINELEAVRKEAFQKGYADGLQQAQEEINTIKAELSKWLDLIQKPVQILDEQLTQEIIQTIIWLSQHCIGIELSINPDKLNDLLNKIKGELPSLSGKKSISMHPDDVQWIKEAFSDSNIPGLHELLLPDPALNRGDFYLQGEHSELDGRIQTRFTTLFNEYINKESIIQIGVSQE